MSRAIVNVATGPYLKGQSRLMREVAKQASGDRFFARTWPAIPAVWPQHDQKPYAFKAYALKEVSEYYDTLLWCDACIVPGARPLADLWEKIERDGVWVARNGWTNYEWTADSAYPDLFSHERENAPATATLEGQVEVLRVINKQIPHVVATAFGISLAHPKGRAFLDEYFRLASKTKAFCGPWKNSMYKNPVSGYVNYPMGPGCGKCGPSDVIGHRHDQTAASVIAWRLGVELTSCPEWFSYRGGENEATCLVADGAY